MTGVPDGNGAIERGWRGFEAGAPYHTVFSIGQEWRELSAAAPVFSGEVYSAEALHPRVAQGPGWDEVFEGLWGHACGYRGYPVAASHETRLAGIDAAWDDLRRALWAAVGADRRRAAAIACRTGGPSLFEDGIGSAGLLLTLDGDWRAYASLGRCDAGDGGGSPLDALCGTADALRRLGLDAFACPR